MNGKRYKNLGSHLAQKHKMLAREYKTEMGIDQKISLLDESIIEKKRDAAIENQSHLNIVGKDGKPKNGGFKKGHKGRPSELMSEQTYSRLTKLNTLRKKTEMECESCGKVMFRYVWAKHCRTCRKKLAQERHKAGGYGKAYYDRKRHNPEWLSERTKKHNEWAKRNKEHLKEYRKKRSYSDGRKCSECETPVTNHSKTGMCIHCYNKNRNIIS